MKKIICAAACFLVQLTYSMEELRPEKRETIQERVESICNNLIGQEYLAIEAWEKCQRKLNSNDTARNNLKNKTDACILQYIIYECAMRNQFLIKR